ncbi:MAG: hypothetical protein NDJ89_17060 [Oligoflexia bacterium]|nr:hypothetical protein [Oligoflexia bacterium]
MAQGFSNRTRNVTLLLLAAGTACLRLNGGAKLEHSRDPYANLTELTVSARYPGASNWNDYVRTADPATPCDGMDYGYFACIHGGEKRQAFYDGASSCTGYSAQDLLGAFDWECAVAGAGRLVFRSKGLKPGKALADLLEQGAWKPQRLILARDGVPIAASPLMSWWTNAVVPLPDNSTSGTPETLASAGAIYTLTSSRDTAGYVLDADRIGVVIFPGAQLNFVAPALPNCTISGSGAWCILSSPNTVNFAWLEGAIHGPSDGNLRGLTARLSHSVIRGLLTSGFSYGIGAPDELNYSNLFSKITASGNTEYGLYLRGSRNTVLDVNATGNYWGVSTGDIAQWNVLQGIIAADNSIGVNLSSGSDNTLSAVTAPGNRVYNMTVQQGRTSITHALIGANATRSSALTIQNSGENTLSQVTTEAVNMISTNGNKFTGVLRIGSYGCFFILSVTPGLTSACANNGFSDATYLPVTWSPSFLPDYRLSASDSFARNLTGDGSTPNAPFVPGQACPALLSGNVVAVDRAQTPRTFLRNALEFIGDEVGNEDGLCESGETCFYAPNFGAYQGEGDPFSQGSCVFQDGTVTGVTLYAYPVNGG